MKKLEDLVPILVNCFRESTSLIRAAPAFDAQSFDCLLRTIQCIHLAVKVSVNESYLPSASPGLLPTSLLVGPNGKRIMSAHLCKLWESFPIGKMHSSTEKVLPLVHSFKYGRSLWFWLCMHNNYEFLLTALLLCSIWLLKSSSYTCMGILIIVWGPCMCKMVQIWLWRWLTDNGKIGDKEENTWGAGVEKLEGYVEDSKLKFSLG